MDRHGSAEWRGSLKEGAGTLSTQSGVLKDVKYDFAKRFGDEPGTNPEEILAAAHAACFSMATSAQLGEMGLTPEYLRTTATATLEKVEAGMRITKIHLVLRAKVPGADEAAFQTAAKNAKEGCPVSNLFTGAQITLDAQLD
jgi:lipoyl-dependent peroxiredoxin